MAKRKWIAEDFNWKIFSVILAVIVWLIVHNFSNGGATSGLLSSQITYTNIPVAALFASGIVPDVRIETNVVSVTVNGPSDVMAALDSDDIHAIINLTGVEAARDLKCRVEVIVPSHVTLLNVDPSDVFVTIPTNK